MRRTDLSTRPYSFPFFLTAAIIPLAVACASSEMSEAPDTVSDSHVEGDDDACSPSVSPWEKWNRSLGFHPETGTVLFQGPSLTADGNVWAFGRDYAAEDGTPLSERDITSLAPPIAVDTAGYRYEIDGERRLTVSRSDTDTPRPIVDRAVTVPLFATDEIGILVVDEGVVAFDTARQDVLWRYDSLYLHTLHSVTTERIYLREATWYAILDTRTGAVLDKSVQGAEDLTLSDDGTIVYRQSPTAICKTGGADFDSLWCVDEEWTIEAMTAAPSGDVYAVVRWPSSTLSMIAIATEAGRFRWMQETGFFAHESELRVNVDGALIYKRPDGIDRIDPVSGTLTWTYPLEETERITGFTIDPSGDFYIIIKERQTQRYRLIRLNHVNQPLRSAELTCSPCQLTCVTHRRLGRCLPDGSGYQAVEACPPETECHGGLCTPCIHTTAQGCDGQDYVYLDSCGNGHHLIESCMSNICDDIEGCLHPTK